ncbi:hypothetical protein HMPREF1221_01371 [Treponema socranskii subsp. paredis ATCC 35535]|nr:hypothetical protein HMPREF1221_01371 [Treponema socranskii subsp. paredis ATCC 35535]
MKLAYPAIITYCEKDKSYSVEFPDLKGCVSGGFSLIEAIEMGIDAASGWLLTEMEDGKAIPKASDPAKIKVADAKSFVNMLILDMDSYSKKYSSKSIRKNITLPKWVNTLAEKNHVNFSQLLQNTIVEKYTGAL